GALVGLDERRVVMALDLEDDGVAIADIDDSGVLARAADHLRAGGRQLLEPDFRGFVGTVLAPHCGDDAELGQVRGAAEDGAGAGKFVGREAHFRREIRGDVGADHAGGLRWSDAVRPSRPRSARHLRMTTFLNATTELRHGEECFGVAEARLEPRTAAPPRQASCGNAARSPRIKASFFALRHPLIWRSAAAASSSRSK